MKTKPLISETEYFRLEFPAEEVATAKYTKHAKWIKWIGIGMWAAVVVVLLVWVAILVKVIFFK